MDEYVRDFVQESEEAITTLNNALLDLESDPDDDAAMDEIFRTAHTLKGNCGAMGFTDASDLAHAMEDLLDAVRAGDVEVTPSLMDQVFEGVDRLEAMLDETRRHGEPQSDPTAVIESLREYVPESGIEEPTDAAVESLLSAADRPTDGAHDVYHARLDIAGRDGSNDGTLVVEALRDAFDLLGTDPAEDDIADGDFEGSIDAAFASPVGEAAISAALEPVDAVEAAIITDATALSDGIDDPTPEPAGGDSTAGPASTAAADAGETPDPDDVSVDELLDDDEVDQFEDLDSMVDEVDDVEGLDDLGDAGSFEGIDAEPEVSSLDETADDEPAVDDLLDEAEDAVDEAEPEPDSGGAADGSDEQVEDASSTFAELQDEVDPVGFDELQDELDELEFDEYDSDEEVGFDELLGEEAEADDDAFEDALDDVDAALAEDGESDDAAADEAAAESDDALEAESGAFDDLVAEDGEAADPFGDDATGGGDPFGQTADADTAADADADTAADADADTATASDGTVDDVLDEVGFGDGPTAEAGETADEAAADGTNASADAADEAGDDTGAVESSGFGDVDLDTEPTVDTTTDVGEFEGFDAPATDADDETDEAAGSAAETATLDEAASGDDGASEGAATSTDGMTDAAAASTDDAAGDSRSAIDQSGPTGGSDGIQSVRVDVEKVDRLMNLVEGMVTSRVRLRRAIERGDSLALLDQELDELEDITAELQDTVMDIRLVPLSTVANRLPRTVRDIAREQGKEVDFELLGGDVELDRSVLNEIGDPLVHIVRNAVDHGVEPPEEREAAGKDPEASVELRARRERDRVVIEVEDDGRGLDADRLRETAVEEGLRTRAEADAMDDEEVYDLVFTAGFSTSEEVTDVSGRGVGMDVVASTVEDLDGDVTVESEPGEGTTVRLSLPVTVAIADVLFVAAGEEEYGIPIKDVQEIGPIDDVATVDGEPVVRRDDEEYPLLDLADELDAPGPRRSGENMLVRVRDDVRPVAIECDEVRGQQEVVVKPYEGVLGDIPGLSGATVLGEGDVVNILDVESL